MNIVFSTTRQWNPGDEFILMGAINLLKEYFGDFNPVIYNRNPQTRRARKYDVVKATDKLLGGEVIEKFLDNSVKDGMDLSFADLIVFAGSPEWRGRRVESLYKYAKDYNIPAIFLGIGTGGEFKFEDKSFSDLEREIFRKSKVITVRDHTTQNGLEGLDARYIPCPALLSAKKEREVKEVKKVGIMYATNKAVKNNNVSAETYEYIMSLYREFLVRYKDKYEIEFVAHYIDELPEFKKDFPNEIINYSYDSKDYIDIYGKFDLIIGTRVHGVGISASQGIPGIMLAHDFRADTVKGFKGELVKIGEDENVFFDTIDKLILEIENKSKDLITHKKEVKDIYLKLFKEKKL